MIKSKIFILLLIIPLIFLGACSIKPTDPTSFSHLENGVSLIKFNDGKVLFVYDGTDIDSLEEKFENLSSAKSISKIDFLIAGNLNEVGLNNLKKIISSYEVEHCFLQETPSSFITDLGNNDCKFHINAPLSTVRGDGYLINVIHPVSTPSDNNEQLFSILIKYNDCFLTFVKGDSDYINNVSTLIEPIIKDYGGTSSNFLLVNSLDDRPTISYSIDLLRPDVIYLSGNINGKFLTKLYETSPYSTVYHGKIYAYLNLDLSVSGKISVIE